MTFSRIRASIFALASVAALAACASGQKPAATTDAVQAREMAAVDKLHLRERYKDAVMGYDVKGPTLNLYVDRNTVESEDESAEEAMLTDVLSAWKKIWSSEHRNQHAKVHLSMRDYYGDELVTRSATV